MKGHNMKRTLLMALGLLALGGCTQKLNAQDEAMLQETHTMAMQSRDEAARAAQEAAAAKAQADAAAAAAQASSERENRIFQHEGNK